jgi:hypothetical protein
MRIVLGRTYPELTGPQAGAVVSAETQDLTAEVVGVLAEGGRDADLLGLPAYPQAPGALAIVTRA